MLKVYNYKKALEDNMLKRILSIISQYSDVPSEYFDEGSNIFDLGIDSLRMLKIIVEIEELYCVKFENQEIVDIRTASDIEKNILEKIK